MPKLLVQTMWYMLNIYFSSNSLEFQYMLGRVCLCDQPSIKTLSRKSLVSFLCKTHRNCTIHVLLQFDAGGIRYILLDSMERGLLETCV